MRIEIFYFSGCPNHVPALDRMREALALEAVPAEIVEIEVKDVAMAERLGFPGSPTIRVNGQDIEPAARSDGPFGLSCRTYVDRGRRAGAPPVDCLRAAVREAGRK